MQGRGAWLLLVLVGLSLWFLWQALSLHSSPQAVVMGPRAFPVGIAALMLVASLALVWIEIGSRRRPALQGRAGADAAGDDDETGSLDRLSVTVSLGAIVALVLLLERLGFLIAVSLFVGGLSTFFEPRRALRNAVAATSFTLLLWLLFTRLLEIDLPRGPLEM